MSAPSSPWMRTALSGVSAWVEPSRCDLNAKPSSASSTSEVLPLAVASEYAWNPPESVSIACGQRVKACRPPRAAIASAPGRSIRWYVLPRTIRAPVDATSPGASVLTLPCVPTGMKVGVSTGPCGVSRTA